MNDTSPPGPPVLLELVEEVVEDDAVDASEPPVLLEVLLLLEEADEADGAEEELLPVLDGAAASGAPVMTRKVAKP